MGEGTRVCLACSAGGHLTELLQLEKAWSGMEHFFVSDRRANALELAERERVFFLVCPRRNPLKLLANAFQALGLLLRERPDVVVSTGADTAVALCVLAKVLGKRVVFIESFCRIKSGSLSGKIMYRFSDLFLVQWPQNREFFPKAEYSGSVF
jgi:UDP-N-acetylglucosamine:LPS N-acetylglucosamine transferase